MTPCSISSTTAICLIIGDPVAHSLSPRMHNAAYDALGLDFVMAASQVREAELPSAIRGVRALSIRGLSVTMPHKISLCSLLDEIDPVATAIGAVNTVVNTGGSLRGYNTDWIGIVRPLEQRLKLANKRIAILGAGGAAQAAAYACSKAGSHVTIFNRTAPKAQELAAVYNASYGELAKSLDVKSFDVIINTTPLGMGVLEGQSPLESHQLSSHQIVFETIYTPRETTLVGHARSAGCTVIAGHEMFLEQGAAQFELHTGRAAPRSAMKALIDRP
jgi:shikimate dehydrogenase